MHKKTGLLIVNLGTPDAPTRGAVYKYLRQFLTDRRVITYPWIFRQLLVQGIIAPFRSGSSAKIYKEVWTEEGSPLKVYGYKLVDKVRKLLGDKVEVELAMRYQSPSIESSIEKLLDKKIDKLVVFPLFPQYASSTVGSIFEEVNRILNKQWNIPSVQYINSYPVEEGMIDLYAQNAKDHFNISEYDHVLISFHGIPVSHIEDQDRHNYCRADGECCKNWHENNRLCYAAQCFATAYAIAEKMELEEGDYTICYQSRLGRAAWLQPYTSDVLKKRSEKGDKKILVFCPAFVADCLETTIEIGEEYFEEFEELGGEKLDLVPSLNDKDEWAETIVDILKKERAL